MSCEADSLPISWANEPEQKKRMRDNMENSENRRFCMVDLLRCVCIIGRKWSSRSENKIDAVELLTEYQP
jgi:hypothetical protein